MAVERPKLTIEFPYDPEDDVVRKVRSDTFFAAWINQFGAIEWTCTDEIDGPSSDFSVLVALMDTESE